MPRTDSSAGETVTPETAMGVSTFYACMRLLSQSAAALPIRVVEDAGLGRTSVVEQHDLSGILGSSPNADQTPYDFIEEMVLSLLGWGDYYAEQQRGSNSGRLIALDSIAAAGVQVTRADSGRLQYRFAGNDGERIVDEKDMLHIRGFGGGKMHGMSVLAYGRQTLGIAQAANNSAGLIFKNGMRPSASLSYEKFLSDEQYQVIEDRIGDKYVGNLNSGRPFIAEGGAKFESIHISAEDAQLLQTRGFSVEEICRLFGVPPFMVGHSEKSTSWGTGIEQQLLGFTKFTLNPFLNRIGQSLSKQLLSPIERTKLKIILDLEELLKTDTKARGEYYKTMILIGAMTQNEVRARENLAPIAGGDIARIQIQYTPLEDANGPAGTGDN